MRILLTRPIALPSSQGVASLNDNGLGLVAAACQRDDVEVTLFSWDTKLTANKFRQSLRRLRPAIVGVKVFTTWFREARATLQIVRQELPDTITIIGGPHPSTSRPEDLFLEFDGLIDLAVAGDAESAMASLVPTLAGCRGLPPARDLAGIPGLVYRDKDRVNANRRCLDRHLDALPMLSWQTQDPERFRNRLLPDNPGNAAMVSDSRGCPSRCGHCMAWLINGGDVRKLSVSRLCAMLDEVVREHNVRVIEFSGNCFMANTDYVREVCEWILGTGVPIRWRCTGAEFLDSLGDPSLLRLMARSGCSAVHFGVESGNAGIVAQLRKPFTLEQMSEVVNRTTQVGIDALGYFMFGFPSETLAQMHDTIEYAMSLPFAQRAFCICLPLPGTSSYKAVLEEQRIDRIDWEHYDCANPRLLPCLPSPRAVRRLLRRARELQMTPSQRWGSRLKHVRSRAGQMKNRLLCRM